MKPSQILAIILALISLSLPACDTHEEPPELERQKLVVTSPKVMDVIITQQFVCQIHAQRHINVRALQDGYLEAITVKEGQTVKAGEVLFSVNPSLYEAKWEAEKAEANLAELELKYTESLAKQKAVSQNEVPLYNAKLKRAQAKAMLAKRELDFTKVKAPFDGIIDRLHDQQGSLIKERDILTTLSDNSVMWVYFNVPEREYLKYMASSDHEKEDQRIELVLASGSKFKYPGNFKPFDKKEPAGAIESRFNNENGTVPFRADFQNPDRLLRHGMTGNVLIRRPLKNAIVIPQRATFEILEKRYVYVVGSDDAVHQREITIRNEQEDIYVIKKGLSVGDKFVYEGIQQVRDGDKVGECEFRPPEQILAHLEYHAE